MENFMFLVVLALFVARGSSLYEKCPAAYSAACKRMTSSYCIRATVLTPSKLKSCQACQDYQKGKNKHCQDHCPSEKCSQCLADVQRTVQECKKFYKKASEYYDASTCKQLEPRLVQCCLDSGVCKGRCQNSHCRNGGLCFGGRNKLSCKCPKGFTGPFCEKSQCTGTKKCQNGGTCNGPSSCACPPDYTGPQCRRKKLGTKLNPAPNAQAILDAGDSLSSGMYWIQPPGEYSPAQTYCDMKYAGGGWMLASYGYVASASSGPSNKAIPNMNNPMGYHWKPDKRAGSHGVINLPHGAVMMARNATYMMMAAGNNPTTGIDQYEHVYQIDLRQNSFKITFANHNRYNGAVGANGIPKMNMTDFVVVGLKGDVGVFERFAFGESLGVTWSDSYPSGYGFNNLGSAFGNWDKGPFFPSVHSGDGHNSCSSGPCRIYQPDISKGSETYVHRGWYTASGTVGKTGQTSIWFK